MNTILICKMDDNVLNELPKERNKINNEEELFCENIQFESKQEYFWYRSPNDSLDYALKFNEPSKISEHDPFLRKLNLILVSFPSLLVTSKVTAEESRKGKTRNVKDLSKNKLPSKKLKELHSKNTDEEQNASLEPNFSFLQEGHYGSEGKSYNSKLVFESNKQIGVLTETNKEKYVNLVKTINSCDISSFSVTFLEKKREFLELLPQINLIQEEIPQVVEVVYKICHFESSLRNDILSSIFCPEFMDNLITYITLLPTVCNEEQFNENEISFLFENILFFCEVVVFSKMFLKFKGVVRKLLVAVQYSIKCFRETLGFDMGHQNEEKLIQLLKDVSTKRNVEGSKTKNKMDEITEDSLEPPNNIRDINIFPTKFDLFGEPPFLRKNIVDGSYRDVEHYIDVQFRLLREDFIGPLRTGIQQFFKCVAEKSYDGTERFDNVRIHEDVKILHGTISNGKFGHLVRFKNELKYHTKRFMFGSLLLFTADDFNSFFCGTVVNLVDQNLLVVELCDVETALDDVYCKTYTMVESEIYFEPYFHVLESLQETNVYNFPMKSYIVDVNPNNESPEHLNDLICPDDLNEAQGRAFISALKNDFVAIQGPPGTGKTFLASKITKHLLLSKNNSLRYSMSDSEDEFYDYYRTNLNRSYKYFSKERFSFKPILLVCFTNHALDQFLENMLQYTSEIVRIGGQCKNTNVEEFNIKNLRYEQRKKYCRNNCYYIKRRKTTVHCTKCVRYHSHLTNVRGIAYSYLVGLKLLQGIDQGLLKFDILSKWMHPQLKTLLQYGQYEEWLLEGAITAQIEDNSEILYKPQVLTSQLLSEFRQAAALRDDLEINQMEYEEKAVAYVNNKFSLTVGDLQKQCSILQKKIRSLQNKGGDEEIIRSSQEKLGYLRKQKLYISHMLGTNILIDIRKIRKLMNTTNVWSIEFNDRWMLYKWWVQHFIQDHKHEMLELENDLRNEEEIFREMKDIFDLQILKSASIIGMTTTSAARLRKTLEDIGPETVIVEEAAEVLESHIIASLNPSVKKVILIGDHKQLRPSTAVYQLAQQYKLDISLFERMINNGLGCEVLNTQHRMRPEIASLIVPAIYPDLRNAETVYNRPDIRGVASNVFFVTHSYPEDEVAETSSRSNLHEVDFLISLCRYLLNQGYDAKDITILSTYAGQMTAMERERRKRHLPHELRITTVDNYQGEENQIILLSLVRSNAEARIGFLSAENRVCVALSRAREGLFIIGNMDNLTCSSNIWKQIKSQLEKMNALGSSLPLGCKNHSGDGSKVSSSNDFKGLPVSGCHVKCEMKLSCGHVCREFCHPLDPDHEKEFSCSYPCERLASCKKHNCLKTCGKECGECKVRVERLLPCGHNVLLECSKDPKLHECREIVVVELKCGHVADKLCSQSEIECQMFCTAILNCGHECNKLCHYSSPSATYLHDKMNCSRFVKKTLPCGHEKNVLCRESETSVNCLEPCLKILVCGHACQKLCQKDCGQCDTMVEKKLHPCGHEMLLKCSVKPESKLCRQPCSLNLTCGHPCTNTCSDDCSSVVCQHLVQSQVEASCGHGVVNIPCHLNTPDLEGCHDLLLKHCQAPCRADLRCGHICAGRCGDCLQGRLHVPCTQMCTRVLSCGHRCEEPCSNECPVLCKRPCLYRCRHQVCSGLCGDPCSPCRRRCERRCVHQECSRPCSDDCDCSPCYEPCLLILHCGHACAGYCGEACPKDCLVCSPHSFVAPDHAFSTDKRYIVLEDCGHAVECELLKTLLSKAKSSNGIANCPICDQLVVQSLRYKDLIKSIAKNLANSKTKHKTVVGNFRYAMEEKLRSLKSFDVVKVELYGECASIIVDHLKKGPYKYKTSLRLLTFYQYLTSGIKLPNDYSREFILERIKLLLKALSLRMESMSSYDYDQFMEQIHNLELAAKDWATHGLKLMSM